MYPNQERPPAYSDAGYAYDPQQQAYHQQGYPGPAAAPVASPGQHAGAPPRGQGPKQGHGARGRSGQQGQNRKPQPKQQQQHKQQSQQQGHQRQQQQRNPQPKQKQKRRRIPDISEISLCIKYALFFANFLFWLGGCGLIAAGIWAWSDRGLLGEIEILSSSPLVDPVWWFICVGLIIFLLATFGCIGALRENIILLKCYSALLGLILLVEIGGGVAVYLYRAKIEESFVSTLTDITITNYRGNDDFQDLVDGVQTGLSCCGLNGYDDWNMNIYFNCSESLVGNVRNLEACGVPFSCCQSDPESEVINTQCGYNVRTYSDSEIRAEIYTTGCVTAFKMWLQTNLVVVSIGAGVILLVEIFGFCFATSLVSDIKRQKARWQQ